MNSDLQTLAAQLEQIWAEHGNPPPISGMKITRAETPTGIIRAVYRPSLCVVMRGAKVSNLANQSHHYRAGQCLLVAMDVPVTARILEASPEQPYLAFSLVIDPALVTELLLSHGPQLPEQDNVGALHTAEKTREGERR